MAESVQLAAVVGSLRRESFNRAVFEAAATLLGPGVALDEIDLAEVPFYNGDIEDAGDPPAVTALKGAVAAADGLIVFTPEYNRSIPAVTKNAIDWLSRFPGAQVLSTVKVGIVAATAGRHEAAGVRTHLAQSIGGLVLGLYEPSLGIGTVRRVVNDGVLTDEETIGRLQAWLNDFVAYVGEPVDDVV